MDIESLEAANQSLQVDLKLAFKRIGDLQAAIEDEMESDDNDDLINRYARVFFLSSSHLDTVNQMTHTVTPNKFAVLKKIIKNEENDCLIFF